MNLKIHKINNTKNINNLNKLSLLLLKDRFHDKTCFNKNNIYVSYNYFNYLNGFRFLVDIEINNPYIMILSIVEFYIYFDTSNILKFDEYVFFNDNEKDSILKNVLRIKKINKILKSNESSNKK